ncbi:unnamed protein product [Acanthoscelides obtectus]|uniref:Uncharacterized protein n=1 Tax=Acanthoscelides obtectus TaxID=200917 RepID=A0A9P0MFQ2_ACAOB|nr:unnamed protein product [Acanthoscelides obtectus]CAK1626423.1 hypothetical protein AOBTE_LOCUS3834 [Acanthoscelides obtectus]
MVHALREHSPSRSKLLFCDTSNSLLKK